MPARVLLALALLQAAFIHLPMPAWSLWLARFVAIETCLLGVVTGLAALVLARHDIERGLAVVAIVASIVPAVGVIPTYVREGQRFSPAAWLGIEGGADVVVERDLAFERGISADLYRGAGTGPRPLVVVIHGGSWRAGDKGDAMHVSRAMAGEGWSVLDLRYRLAPFPAAIEDVRCALAEVRARREELGVDPDRVALLGRSAGAQIALLAAYSDHRLPLACPASQVRAVVGIYGPTDLAWGHAHPFVPDVVRGPEAIEQYMGGPPDAVPERYRLATALSWLDRPIPATLVIHGLYDRCVRARHAERLRDAAPADVTTLFVPFAEHGFDIRRGGFGEQLARGAILRFLRERL